MLTDAQDAYGHMVWDYFHDQKDAIEIVERDDGLIGVSPGAPLYFAPYDQWSELDKAAIELVRGRVLDVGSGAGRHALYLQERGHDVVGIDVSPLASKVCRLRGVRDARVLSITQVGPELGPIDTVIMMGNNWGLMGGFRRARWLLRRFRGLTSDQGRIVAFTTDPYDTETPEHLWYHEHNRQRGRMGGQTRLRVRYKKYATPWFDYLLVSRTELEEILAGTGWAVTRFLDAPSSQYVAIIDKVGSA